MITVCVVILGFTTWLAGTLILCQIAYNHGHEDGYTQAMQDIETEGS